MDVEKADDDYTLGYIRGEKERVNLSMIISSLRKENEELRNGLLAVIELAAATLSSKD